MARIYSSFFIEICLILTAHPR